MVRTGVSGLIYYAQQLWISFLYFSMEIFYHPQEQKYVSTVTIMLADSLNAI